MGFLDLRRFYGLMPRLFSFQDPEQGTTVAAAAATTRSSPGSAGDEADGLCNSPAAEPSSSNANGSGCSRAPAAATDFIPYAMHGEDLFSLVNIESGCLCDSAGFMHCPDALSERDVQIALAEGYSVLQGVSAVCRQYKRQQRCKDRQSLRLFIHTGSILDYRFTSKSSFYVDSTVILPLLSGSFSPC
jgi:hypothetical protein